MLCICFVILLEMFVVMRSSVFGWILCGVCCRL